MKSLQGIVVYPDYLFIKTRCSADRDRSSMVSAFLGKSASITAGRSKKLGSASFCKSNLAEARLILFNFQCSNEVLNNGNEKAAVHSYRCWTVSVSW